MYEVHHRRSFCSRRDFVRIGTPVMTLEEAKALRAVSGDLVVDSVTHEVVKSDVWLFDWELIKLDCYARKAMNDSIEVIPVFDMYGYLVGTV
jgi:hypothetical protein